MRLLKSPFILFFLFLTSTAVAQSTSDSLHQLLSQDLADTVKCDVYLQLSDFHVNTNVELAANYADSAITISKQLQDNRRLTTAYDRASSALWYKGEYYKAIAYTKQAIAILEVLKDTTALGNQYNGLGLNYTFLSQYEKALEFSLKSLAINEAQNDSSGKIILYSNVGDLYRQLGDPKKSLRYQKQARELNKILQIPIFKGIVAYCTAYAHQDLGDYEKALAEYKIALSIGEKLKYQEIIHRTLNRIAEIYTKQQQFPDALSNSQEALSVAKEMKSKRGETLSLLNIGNVLKEMGDFSKSEQRYREALALSQSGNMNDLSRDTYEALSDLYFEKKDYKNSLTTRKRYEQLKDSIFNADMTKQVAEAQTLYESEKKQKEIETLKLQQEADKAVIQQQRTQTFALVAFIAIIVAVGVNIYRNRQKLQSANRQLNEKNNAINTQNEELHQQSEEIKSQRDFIEEQKNMLVDKNKQLTDSIRYAQTIQAALLPFDVRMKRAFSSHGIIYKPKDIVSGDFYWLDQIDNKKLFAVVDCTGHGVPGAFMSIIGLSLLNDEVRKKKITDPSQILENLNHTVQRILQQEHSANADGMDIGLCAFEELPDGSQKVTFAGARRPLYYITENKELHIIKGDKQSVGGRNRKEKIAFSNHEIILQKGDIIYLTTDGYVDQNNSRGRKFGSVTFEKLLIEIMHLPLPKQVNQLEETLTEFMFGQNQRDDIAVVGLEL